MKYPFYASKQYFEDKHSNLLLIKEGSRHYALINCFNIFSYDHTLHRGRKNLCCRCLQAIIAEEILKRHVKDYFKILDKQRIKMPKNGEYFRFKIYEKNK